MKRKLVILGLILTLVALPLIACAKPAPTPAPTPAPAPAPAPAPTPAPAPPPAKPTEPVTLAFDWSTVFGRANCLVFPYRPGGRLDQLVTKYTDGLLKFDYKENLYGVQELVFAVGDGRVDIGAQLTAYVAGTYPLLDFGAIPGVFASAPDSGYEWANAFHDPRMTEILDKYTRPEGFKIIGGTISLSHVVWTGKKPLRTVEDFKGLKTRSAGRTATSAIAAIGASPVALAMPEVEEALYRGTVDAVVTAKSYGAERGLIDLADYVNEWVFNPVFPAMTIVNADKFYALDPFLQAGLLKAGAQVTQEAAMVVEQMEYTYTLWIQASRTELITPEKGEIERGMGLMGPVIEEWIGYAGPYGKDVLNIAIDYATGPNVNLLKSILAK